MLKIQLLVIGKTDVSWLQEGIAVYADRLKYYAQFSLEVLPDVKNRKSLSVQEQKTKEAQLLLPKLATNDFVVLMDENGKQYKSVDLAQWIEQISLRTSKIVFIIGGPYGFDEALYARSNAKIALSTMTFSHQMVRVIFLEQLYRAFTIIKKEPYHHE